MNKRTYIHLVIALCLWLPLQAIAGQWMHCAQLETFLQKPSASQSVSDLTTNIDHTESCHSVANSFSQNSIHQDQTNAQSSDVKSCKHCQFSCHWHFVILLKESSPQMTDPRTHLIPFKISSPEQPLLAQAQKPPRFFFS